MARRPDYSNLPSRIDIFFLVLALLAFYLTFHFQSKFGTYYFVSGLIVSSCLLFIFAVLSYLNTLHARKVCKLMVEEARKVLKGDETILEVCTGTGMLLISLAKLLTKGGKASGVDVWESTEQRKKLNKSTRTQQLVLSNAEIEGVSDRITIIGGDPRNLPFKTDSADLVVAMKLFHHLSSGSSDRTLVSMCRVCKPGGYIYIHDFWRISAIRAMLTRFGMEEVKVIRSSTLIPAAKLIIFRKPLEGLGERLSELEEVKKASEKKNQLAEKAGVHLASLTKEQAAEMEAIRQKELAEKAKNADKSKTQ